MNAAHLAAESIKKYGEYTAYRFEGRDWSNTEHASYSARLAAVLHKRGVQADDRVPVVMPNCPEVLACFQAVWQLGAAIVPTTPQLSAREIGYVLDHSDVKLVITSPELAAKVAEAAAGAPDCKQVLVIGDSDVAGAENIAPAIEAAPEMAGMAERSDDDMAFLLYTSGTTGHPKGVVLTHGNIVLNHRAVAATGRLKERSQTILTLPMSHSFGVLMMNVCYLSGCSGAILRKFSAEGVVQAIERYKVTRFSVVPTMMVHLNNFPDLERYDLSSLEMVQSGAAILPNEVRIEFERLYGCKVIEGYGMSECAPAACTYHWDEPYRPGAVGRPLSGVSISIQDEDGAVLPPGGRGEICIQGPNVMKGYWKDEDATREALRGGWLHSGDAGYMDEDGYVYLTDRIKDLIIKGGENISPREIEDALYQHRSVSEVVVVGVPDPTYGENIVAVVALKPGETVTGQDLIRHAAECVTKFKLPCRVVFKDTLPRNANNKIDRKRLREEIGADANL